MRNRKFLIFSVLLLGAVVGYYALRPQFSQRPPADVVPREATSPEAASREAVRSPEAESPKAAIPQAGRPDEPQKTSAEAALCLSPYLRLTRRLARERADACTQALDQGALPEPQAANAFAARADARLAAGDRAGAAADSREALLRIDRIEASAGTDAEVLRKRAIALQSSGETQAALDAYNAALAAAPNDFATYYRRGLLRIAPLGDYSGAVGDLDKALDLAPDTVDALILRGDAYGRLGKAAAAMADLNRAVALAPGYGPAFVHRGMERARTGDLDGSLRDFGTALAIDPDDFDALANRGAIYATERQFVLALKDLDRAVEVSDTDALAWYNRGFVLFQLRRFDAALDSYSSAIAADPAFGLAYVNRCLMRTILGRDLADARTDCDRALELTTNSVDVRETRGLLFLKLGQPKEALAEYDKALTFSPTLALSLYGRGLARLRLGDAAGETDKRAAAAIDPEVANQFTGYGIE